MLDIRLCFNIVPHVKNSPTVSDDHRRPVIFTPPAVAFFGLLLLKFYWKSTEVIWDKKTLMHLLQSVDREIVISMVQSRSRAICPYRSICEIIISKILAVPFSSFSCSGITLTKLVGVVVLRFSKSEVFVVCDKIIGLSFQSYVYKNTVLTQFAIVSCRFITSKCIWHWFWLGSCMAWCFSR